MEDRCSELRSTRLKLRPAIAAGIRLLAILHQEERTAEISNKGMRAWYQSFFRSKSWLNLNNAALDDSWGRPLNRGARSAPSHRRTALPLNRLSQKRRLQIPGELVNVRGRVDSLKSKGVVSSMDRTARGQDG